MTGASQAHTRSFKEALSSRCSSPNASINIVHSSYKGSPAIFISKKDSKKLAESFAFSLIDKFGLKRPNMDRIREFFVSLKLAGDYSIRILDAHHVVIKMTNDSDYSRVFAKKWYYLFNYQMQLLKWTLAFNIKEESPIAPVWISFPNIKLHLMTHEILFSIAAVFGRPLQVDQATTTKTRPSVTRI